MDPSFEDAPASCPECGAPVAMRMSSLKAAKYRCQSTTRSIADGFAFCRTAEGGERARAVALYRQFLKREGKSDPLL